MCANGGTCVNKTCVCPDGWTGIDCKQEKCNPECLHDGICKNGQCQCTGDWEGDHCQNPKCTKNCQNGAACVNNECVCSGGWAGDLCDRATCDPYCQNGGTCKSPNVCECTAGYDRNTNCEKSLCSPDCGVGGICEYNATSSKMMCTCKPGFHGSGCDIVNPCSMPYSEGVSAQFLDEAFYMQNNDKIFTGNAAAKNACFKYLDQVDKQCSVKNTTFNQAECEKYCVPSETNDICKKIWNPIGYGIAPSSVKRANESFYYDASSKSCKPFNSLGCLGNANNFVSEQSCKVKCTLVAPTNVAPPPTIDAPGSCFVNGREHFNTFDNTGYRFSGPCSSMLVLDSENPEQFKVVLNGDPKCDIYNPCQKSLDLIIDGVNVHLGKKTNTSFVVKVEGKAIDLPHTTTAPYMKKSGRYVLVKSQDHINILWDGQQDVIIKVPDSYKLSKDHKLVGLCGLYDGNGTNDFTDIQGNVKLNPTQDEINAFADSFKQKTTCDNSLVIKPPKRTTAELCSALLGSSTTNVDRPVL